MKPSKTSKAWLNEHVHDHYVQRARSEGFRARAAFKLLEIDDRDRLLRPGMTVVDLGAAPGSWSQVLSRRLAGSGRAIALDLLPMAPVAGVAFVQGDFADDAVLRELEARLGERPVDLVLSDMAPNFSGVASIDQARAYALAELALEFAEQRLAPSGRFLVKVFQGPGFDDYRRHLGEVFLKVAVRKPKASRDRSSEVYFLAQGRK
ncbi:MAG: 23S rRNA (uridine(2552)-2'-O)-methyltransferase RlmE [Rhodocyclaceae bacterium]|nr:23S rRNA (uridine(2552)-2'-O)-methyltransferase RlmE [Rhodocyclaceae bacterium]